ncbi:MAG: gliding motility-associated C-terminal domain-containing protein [Bacteroidales bacterium]|nr:gliding motility-associated C-terminal domain-containing protein [Bacteroidales bacterium]
MRRLLYVFLLMFILPLFDSSIRAQTAGFIMDTTMGCGSLRVTFINTSTPDGGETLNDYDFLWSFASSTRRDTSRVSHTFNSLYKDTLIAITLTMRHKNIEGKTASFRDTIRIRPIPNAWFQIADHPIDTLLYVFRSGKAPSDTIAYRYIWQDITANRVLRTHPNATAIETSGSSIFRRDTLIHTFNSSQTGYRTLRLSVSDWYGCSAQFDTTILVSPTLVVPKFFTPNGDGRNDFFYVQTNGKDFYKLEIFNSRGQRIYHSIAQTIMWDGIIETSGQPAPAGTYYYYIESTSGIRAQAKGFFVLLRQ